MTTRGDGPDFEDWLRDQFRVTLGDSRGPRPHPAQSAYRAALRVGMKRRRAGSGLLAEGTGRAAAAAAGIVLAIGSGAVVATAATGSANPAAWGQVVVQAVQDCKEQVSGDDRTDAGGPRNVGQCVSAVARQHGEQQRSEHASDGRKHEPARPSASPGGRGQGSDRQEGAPGQTKEKREGTDEGSEPLAEPGQERGTDPGAESGDSQGGGIEGAPGRTEDGRGRPSSRI